MTRKRILLLFSLLFCFSFAAFSYPQLVCLLASYFFSILCFSRGKSHTRIQPTLPSRPFPRAGEISCVWNCGRRPARRAPYSRRTRPASPIFCDELLTISPNPPSPPLPIHQPLSVSKHFTRAFPSFVFFVLRTLVLRDPEHAVKL
ncbi:hypothetical protein IWX49DRAFT_119381 [Phyllosticta citricarpa]